MDVPETLTLRAASADDLPAIAGLRESVGWGVNQWALRAVVGRPFARCLVVDADSGIAGVGSGIVYGSLGFIGNMIVAEAHRRRGIGSAILTALASYLETAGCTRLELNATSDGRPLYERHGFASTGRSATAILRRDLGLRPDPSVAIRTLDAGDLAALAAYDRPRFGGERRQLLELLLDDAATEFVGVERRGELAGYASLRTDTPRIGPVLADEPSIAETLLAEGFARTGTDELRLNLPPNNRLGAAWLRSLGVAVEPWDGRMARGPALPRREETLYGMTVGALG